MARFLTSLDVRYHSPDKWELLSPLVVVAKDKLIRVPPGFTTDFASVPRIPLAFMLFGNIGHRAATVHDYLYQTGQVPREDADAIFRELLTEEGAGPIRSTAMYLGVRAGGASHYQGQ